MKMIFTLVVVFSLNVHARKFNPALLQTGVKEADIIKCEKDSDCIIVPFRHCCGSTKKAINKKFLDLYNKTPEWQKFDNQSTCAMIGACQSDEKIREAKCNSGQCNFRFPEN